MCHCPEDDEVRREATAKLLTGSAKRKLQQILSGNVKKRLEYILLWLDQISCLLVDNDLPNL